MNIELLRRHIRKFAADARRDPGRFDRELRERVDAVAYYQQFVPERILAMTAEEVYEYLSRLWANLIWGNKHYVVDKVIEDNGLEYFKMQLSELAWGRGKSLSAGIHFERPSRAWDPL